MENGQKALPQHWLEVRRTVEMDGWVLSENVFEQTRRIFDHHYAEAGSLENLTQEYSRPEYLLVVDEQGTATGGSKSMLERYRTTAALHPQFTRWYQEDILPSGPRVLLAARWLCHLIGLRHGTVEIFIDPPFLERHTLVQVRGLDKFEAPGAFDIPCAGHISSADTAEETLRKELAEELNLTLDDLTNLHLLKQYNSYTGVRSGTETGVKPSVNNEYRVLYRAQLKSSAAENIRFTDGEVVGVAIFSVPGLRAMVDRYPERIASGLGDAIGFYV